MNEKVLALWLRKGKRLEMELNVSSKLVYPSRFSLYFQNVVYKSLFLPFSTHVCVLHHLVYFWNSGRLTLVVVYFNSKMC